MAVTVLYPIGYEARAVTLAELRRVHEPKMHPEFGRRLWPWLEAQGGAIGIGSGWRATQPALPGFAPEGRSFHQDQRFASGFVGYCAVDLVGRDGPDANNSHDGVSWAMVPAQGSLEAKRWGVHCNVGRPGELGSEPWHMQPIEIDGWQSWVDAGRPDPQPPEDDDMVRYFKLPGDAALTVWATADDLTAVRLEAVTAQARGVDVFKVPTITADEAARFVYQPGLPFASVR